LHTRKYLQLQNTQHIQHSALYYFQSFGHYEQSDRPGTSTCCRGTCRQAEPPPVRTCWLCAGMTQVPGPAHMDYWLRVWPLTCCHKEHTCHLIVRSGSLLSRRGFSPPQMQVRGSEAADNGVRETAKSRLACMCNVGKSARVARRVANRMRDCAILPRWR
jgi:hypothetical protein